MLSNSLLHQARRSTGIIVPTVRGYISRAHPPETTAAYPIGEALATVLEDVGERFVFRQQRWDKGADKRKAKNITEDGPYRNQDETIELALNLNLDPRKPGQAIRGSISLPHGTGKKVNVVVFTSDDQSETIQSVKEAGAAHAGGASLIQSIANGEIPVNFDRALATPDMMPQLSKIARILGPRGLMPNAKLDTIQPADRLAEAVKAQAAGMVQFRTDKNGIVHAGVGKGSFTPEQLSDNIREFMNAIQTIKPESYGKGKKKTGGAGKDKGKGGGGKDKFFLKAYLGASQAKGSLNVDFRTLDPTSSSFMAVAP